ncbi:hypothetical protein BJV82DRAFT_668725 [Fennellomyces sp. T-0311]|nr:hypothetical protein BJV82DRAFT_668725 [Fennellomyces sp. T-0311]
MQPAHIDSPIATDSVTNKPPSQKASLYHTCRAVLNGLAAVPGFDIYLAMDPEHAADDPPKSNDPLSKLWFICRQGASLCLLFNTLMPENAIQLQQPNGDLLKPKACVYHFIIACRDHLGLDQDGLFTVTDLYQDDTNGFVKVVNTMRKILELLEGNGTISIKHHRRHSSTSTPKDTRGKVVTELLETERKYVQDLESLQYYMREAQAQKVLPPDTLHQLFGNLNALVDFQRRFLIHAEDNADRAPQDQRFGSLFVQLEDAFSVYEPFCANFQTAQALVVQETAKLQKLADIMSPTYELPSMLIKPVQRVCKYPLLLQELVKSTPEDWSYYAEMKMGLEAIQRVASKVNETKRRQENMVFVDDLKRRILDESWKGAIPSYGCLLLHERFIIYRNDADYDVLMYLFEKSLFICKEEKDVPKKSNTISVKKKKPTKEGGLQVKGRIFISQIAQVTDISQSGQWTLRIFWSERDSIQSFNLKSFILKCRNAEQLRQWEAALNKLIQNEKRLSRESRAAAEGLAWKHQQTSIPSTPVSTQRSAVHPMPELFSGHLGKFGEDDEDDDEYVDDELLHSSDEEDSGFYGRLRSNSQSAHSYRSRNQYTENGHKSSQSSVSLPSSCANGNLRHPTMPGMTLPPLPRDSAIDTSPGYSCSPPISYPSSPLTNSYPSSPSASTRASTSSSGSSQIWQRRGDTGLLPTEMIGRNTLNEGGADDYPFSGETGMHNTRMRSQSSPNIHQAPLFEDAKDVPLPINSRTLYYHQQQKRLSSGYQYEDPPPPQQQLLGNVKVKLNYMDGVYVIVVPLDINYNELVDRIERKVRLYGRDMDALVGLKYQDEDGDLITISSSEDVQMGFESRGASNTVSLFVVTSPSTTTTACTR